MPVTPRDPNSESQLDRLNRLAIDIRGSILDQAIWIEALIDDIVAWHFCPQEAKRNLLFSLVLKGTELTFSDKIGILECLLRLEYSELKEQYPGLKDHLDKLRRLRNRLAHAMLDTSDQFLQRNHTDRIQLVYFEDGREKQWVLTISERDQRLREFTQVVWTLLAIQQEVRRRVSEPGASA